MSNRLRILWGPVTCQEFGCGVLLLADSGLSSKDIRSPRLKSHALSRQIATAPKRTYILKNYLATKANFAPSKLLRSLFLLGPYLLLVEFVSRLATTCIGSDMICRIEIEDRAPRVNV
jgi:hypothetical protein